MLRFEGTAVEGSALAVKFGDQVVLALWAGGSEDSAPCAIFFGPPSPTPGEYPVIDLVDLDGQQSAFGGAAAQALDGTAPILGGTGGSITIEAVEPTLRGRFRFEAATAQGAERVSGTFEATRQMP